MFKLDFIGTLLSLVATYFFVKIDKRAWPVAIVATFLNTILYLQGKIYASMVLELIYLFLSIYGWHAWYYGNNKQNLAITTLKVAQCKKLALVVCALCVAIFYLLTALANNNIALIEAIAVSISLLAEWLTTRKKIECWAAWLIADFLFIYIMLYNGLYWHGLLFTVYLIMAIFGWFNWHKIRQQYQLQMQSTPCLQ